MRRNYRNVLLILFVFLIVRALGDVFGLRAGMDVFVPDPGVYF